MSKKTYAMFQDDTAITIEIDVEAFGKIAKDINGFWSGHEWWLNVFGCHTKAALALIAGSLCHLLIDGYTELAAVAQLADEEGYPDNLSEMLKITGSDMPTFGAGGWEFAE